MEFSYYIFLVVVTVFIFLKTDEFIFFIPVFHVFMDMSFNFFPTLSIVTYARPAIILLYLFLILKKIRYRKIYIPFYLFFLYIFILTAISDESIYSLRGSSQAFISMIMFIVGFELINSHTKMKNLLNSIVWVMIISLIATGLGYVFGIGRNFDYAKDKQAIGLLGSGGMYAGALGILLMPLIISGAKKYLHIVLLYLTALSTYIFILLNIRRTAILIPVVGYFVFLFLIPRRGKLLTSVLVALFVLIILSPFYSDLLISRFEARREQGRFDENFYETEGRFVETKVVLGETFSFNDVNYSLFGKNIFASGYSRGKKLDRMLHTDHAVLLAGGGIIGLILYLYIYIVLIAKINIKTIKSTPGLFFSYRAMYAGLIVVSIFVSLNGSISQVTYRSILFLFLGALLSAMTGLSGTQFKRNKVIQDLPENSTV